MDIKSQLTDIKEKRAKIKKEKEQYKKAIVVLNKELKKKKINE